MRWEAPSIARFATEAGFVRPDVHTATALALASSGGLDHYDLSAGIPGAGRWVGLWGLNVDEWPEYAADELTDPERAAQVAYELTQRCVGFGWSSSWRAGRERHWLDHVIAAHGRDPFTETDHVPIVLNRAERQITALAHRTRGRHRYG